MAPSLDCCIQASYHSGKPIGEETKLGKYDAYVTGSKTSNKAILMIHDVFGKTLVNTRVLADKYAQGIGARVYLPDFFEGRDLQIELEKDPNVERSKVVPQLLNDFPGRQWERFPPVIEEIRKVQPSVKKIGAIGYCWGGTGALFLGSKKAGASQVDAVAFAHPSLLEVEDFEMVEKPGLFMTCENDPQFGKEKQEKSKNICEKLAKENGVFTRFSYYPFVSHGWSIKGDETNPYSAKAMNHAAAEAITFFSLEL